MQKRHAVHNHLGVIDSNALFTLAQLAVGVAVESYTPSSHRWILQGADIDYIKMAKSDVVAVCDCRDIQEIGSPDRSEANIEVTVLNGESELVQVAHVRVSFSPRTNA